ncbi:MAG: aminotransferase class V-fold PLP-dependent enzyme [Campylobacterales bacterium]
MNKYIIDNQIILDILIPRFDEFQESLRFFEYILKNKTLLFVTSSQISNLEYVLHVERKKIDRDFTKKDAQRLLSEFYKIVTFIKTPSYIDIDSPAFVRDSEDYLIELAAQNIDAKIISRDGSFLKSSKITISINDFLAEQNSTSVVKFLDLHRQYSQINSEIDKAIDTTIKNSAFVGGKHVEQFENQFAMYQEAEYCLGVGNGTDALEIALWSLELPKNSEVIVPANSFIATSEAVTRNGLNIKFADCDENYQLCPKSLEQQITPQTKAVIVVHLYGHPANMDEIMPLVKKYDLRLIEDCAQAHGAEYRGKKVGTFGDLATFSFYPGKNLGAYGDSGAILSSDEKLITLCRSYANHGRTTKFAHEMEGRNSRLDGLQATILSVKLNHLDLWIQKRNEVAAYYFEHIKNPKITLPQQASSVLNAFHLFVVQTQDRDGLKEFLQAKHIQTGIHYPVALPKLKAYEYLQQDCSDFKACREDERLLSLPIGEHLSLSDLEYIIRAINEWK